MMSWLYKLYSLYSIVDHEMLCGCFGSFGWNKILLASSSQFRRPKTGRLMDEYLYSSSFLFTLRGTTNWVFARPRLTTHCPRLYHRLVFNELFIPSKIQNTKIRGLSKIRLFSKYQHFDQGFTGRDRTVLWVRVSKITQLPTDFQNNFPVGSFVKMTFKKEKRMKWKSSLNNKKEVWKLIWQMRKKLEETP